MQKMTSSSLSQRELMCQNSIKLHNQLEFHQISFIVTVIIHKKHIKEFMILFSLFRITHMEFSNQNYAWPPIYKVTEDLIQSKLDCQTKVNPAYV